MKFRLFLCALLATAAGAFSAPNTLSIESTTKRINEKTVKFPSGSSLIMEAGSTFDVTGATLVGLSGSGVPAMGGQSGKILTNNGTAANWADISTLLSANLNAITGPGIAVISRPTLTFTASKFGGNVISLLGSASGSLDFSPVDAACGSHTIKFQSVTGIGVVGEADNNYFGQNNFQTSAGTAKHFTISGDGNFFVGNTGTIAIAGFSTFDILGSLSLTKVNGTAGTNVETDQGFTAAKACIFRDTIIYARTAGSIGLDVFGAIGQTAAVAKFSDNGDGDAITITKDIDLDMGGNKILNALVAAHSRPFVTKTSNYSVTTADDTIYANAAGGSFTITLPAPGTTAAAGYSYCYRIKRVDTSGNTVSVVVTGGVLMDTYATLSLAPWQSVDLQSNGTLYLIH